MYNYIWMCVCCAIFGIYWQAQETHGGLHVLIQTRFCLRCAACAEAGCSFGFGNSAPVQPQGKTIARPMRHKTCHKDVLQKRPMCLSHLSQSRYFSHDFFQCHRRHRVRWGETLVENFRTVRTVRTFWMPCRCLLLHVQIVVWQFWEADLPGVGDRHPC